jgi:hypothetical protein
MSLVGHPDVSVAGREVLRMPIFARSDGAHSVGSRSAPEIGSTGCYLVDENDIRQFWLLIRCLDREAPVRWKRTVLGALKAAW